MSKSAAAQRVEPSEAGADYGAHSIEVLEGLEPVRRRPGMYVGGTDERALHHLFAEILDNAMDEAVAGHAKRIEIVLEADGTTRVTDNGRGIPTDPHPRFPDKSALEVIFTTLHAGGKFSEGAYQTAGGLHGVGSSVVNALSERLDVEVARGGRLFAQSFSRGVPLGPLEERGAVSNRRGTMVAFRPDPEIFGPEARMRPARIFRMARSKAYLYRGVEIRWRCAPDLLPAGGEIPAEAVFHFPNGLADHLAEQFGERAQVTGAMFAGRVERENNQGIVEWAISWTEAGFGEADGFVRSYCNTIPTPEGGTHESGFRAALLRGLKTFADLKNEKRAGLITADDIFSGAGALISVFIRDPEFQGQTKDKLSSDSAHRLVESTVRDRFETWLGSAPKEAERLLEFVVRIAEDRVKRRKEREIARAAPTRRLRLPGKLADCARQAAEGTEIFLVEGDSAGGSAKQARDRNTQAILPLRGKILNVASAGGEKIDRNQELTDLALALGVQTGARFRLDDLRYERVIIMTDADVDGAHIASLLLTFFFRQMRPLVDSGRLFLAMPPLYRLAAGTRYAYARDDAHRAELMRTVFAGKSKVEVSRFKGLGEMMPAQLRETTMAHATRTLARVSLDDLAREGAEGLIETLMGKRAERRFEFIQRNARFVPEVDV